MLVNSNELHSIYAPKKNKTLVIQIPVATFERYYTDDGFIYFSHSSRIQDEEVMGLFEEMRRRRMDMNIRFRVCIIVCCICW